MKILLACFLSLASKSSAVKTIMEGIVASNNTILIDTTNARVDIATNGYPGNVPSVGAFISSNVVVSKDGTSVNGCVIYATGSITCLGSQSNHSVIFTVAPSGATAADKSRADFVGDGVNDQIAISSAITSAGTINSKVIVLPGSYTFGASLVIPSGTNRVFDMEGTLITGPGSTDTVRINGCAHDRFHFGTISSSGVGDAIRVVGCTETLFSWQALQGASQQGNGFHVDATGTGSSVDYIFGTRLYGFNNGIFFDDSTNIDTITTWLNFGHDCNRVIYEHGGNPPTINSNRWYVNVDASWNVGIATAVETNAQYDTWDITPATGINLALDSGADRNNFGFNPPFYFAQSGVNKINDNSGKQTNIITSVGMPISLAALGKLVKWDDTTMGVLHDTLISVDSSGNMNMSNGSTLTASLLVATSTPVVFGTSNGSSADFNGSGSGKSEILSYSSNNTSVVNDLGVVIRNESATQNATSGLHFSGASGGGSNKFPIFASIVGTRGPVVSGQYSTGTLHILLSKAANGAPSEVATLTYQGNLGIGITNPSFSLDTNSYEQISNSCTTVTTCTATCSAGKQVMGGGCTGVTSTLADSSPGSSSSWTCQITLGNVTAKAICINMN